MSVLLPSSTLPHVMNRSRLLYWWERRYSSMSTAMRSEACAISRSRSSEIPCLLLLLHRPGAVEVDDPPLALRRGGEQHLLDDVQQRRRLALDRARQRVATERAEADRTQLGHLAVAQRHAV